MSRAPTIGTIGTIMALMTGLGLGCVPETTPLPTVEAVASLDRAAQPPLYQLLYDAPALPTQAEAQQRVRLLIWLRHMALSIDQLDRLEELRALAADRRARIGAKEQEVAERYSAQETQVYNQLWAQLAAGTPVDDPQMGALTDELRELRQGGARERELLAVRMEGIRSVMDAQRAFLVTLRPRQEQLMADALFFLRHRLDPVGNPADFRALVGSIYDPGQYAVLTRGGGEHGRQPLNIGALWSDQPMLEGHALHEARREVLLFLALLEPGLDQAIAAARDLEKAGGTVQPGVPEEPAPQ